MAARLGARVSMVGALGDDVYAGMTLDNLAAQGVDATHVARVAGSSGVAPIWVEPDGTNRIIVVPGANDEVDPAAAAAAVRSLRPASRHRPARDPAGRHGGRVPRGARPGRRHHPESRARGGPRRRPARRRRLADPERDRVRDPRRHHRVRPVGRCGAGRLRRGASGRDSSSRSASRGAARRDGRRLGRARAGGAGHGGRHDRGRRRVRRGVRLRAGGRPGRADGGPARDRAAPRTASRGRGRRARSRPREAAAAIVRPGARRPA